MTEFKKYHNLLMIPAIAVISVTLLSGFSVKENDEIVRSALIERTMILQDALFGALDIRTAEEKLKKIETYPLISEDVRNISEAEDTDFNRVMKMTFKNMEKKQSFMDYETYEGDIIWSMRSGEGVYESCGKYYISVKKTGSSVLISRFIPIE